MLGTLWLATTLYNFNQTPYLQVHSKPQPQVCLKASNLNPSWCYYLFICS